MPTACSSPESTTAAVRRDRGAWTRRAGELLVGHGVNAITEKAFDWLLYPAVIYGLGLLWGGVAMAAASLAVCLCMLWAYDRTERDWLGIEALKTLRDGRHAGGARRWISGLLRRGDAIAFVALTVQADPLITTLYLRRTAYARLSRRDWTIFLFSWAIGNAYWTLACYGGIGAIRWLWGQS